MATPKSPSSLEPETSIRNPGAPVPVVCPHASPVHSKRTVTAKKGTINVNPYKSIEHYSHVMHMVSGVQGELGQDKDAFDLFAAAFPAGTLVGAPKVRAMELIDSIEPELRGIYGGTVGYFGKNGDMDQAIAIRTIVFSEGQYSFQAGGGIVADSKPDDELQEVMAKSEILRKALEMAVEGMH